MSTFTIHLAHKHRFRLPIPKAGIEKDLKKWFDQSISYGSSRIRKFPFKKVKVQWWSGENTKIQVGIKDVLVYVLPSHRDTLIKQMNPGETPTIDEAGITYTHNNETLSEVYTRCASARYIAETIWHEILHNKTGWSNGHQHRRGGLAGHNTSVNEVRIEDPKSYRRTMEFSGRSTPNLSDVAKMRCRGTVSDIIGRDQFTSRNKIDMAKCMKRVRRQWTTGLMKAPKRKALNLNAPIGL